MIPDDPIDRSALAGEYVLGLLDADEAREIEQALPSQDALRGEVAFWENRLHPLAALAPASDPPLGIWEKISSKIEAANPSRLPVWWNNAAPWRWTTAGLAAAAAALLLVVARPPTGPHFVGVLNAPSEQAPSFVVLGGHREIVARAAGAAPPAGRAFELWAIYPNVSRPQALGVIPANGVLRVKDFPTEILAGASLAVSVEPPGGSPTGQPTGPVVFVGKLRSL